MTDLIDKELAGDTVRSLFAASTSRDIDARLEAFGLRDMLQVDPQTWVPAVFEAQGAAGVTSQAIHEVAAVGLGPIRQGAGPHGVVVPRRWNPKLALPGDLAVSNIDGLVVSVPASGQLLLAALNGLGDVRMFELDAADPDLQITTPKGIDPDLRITRVRGVPASLRLVDSDERVDDAWTAVVAWSQIAIASEIVGAVRAALEIATTHARDRSQFGRPIGSFQAVKHRLADVQVAVEGAAASISTAARHPDALSAMVAKSTSGRAARLAAANCLQVLGGVGFTVAHPFNGYLKRMLLLDRLFGSASELPKAIGANIIAAGSAARLVEL